jgi:SPASM domain peptide maturase of grasp-with-spasm system
MISKVYILSPNCIIVKGHLRCTLLDLQKNTPLIITNSLSKILSKPISEESLGALRKNDFELVKELINREILVLIPKSQVYLFPKLNKQFHNVSEINNIIIELSASTLTFANKIRDSLNNLNCKFVEVRVSKDIAINELIRFLKQFSNSTVQGITIYIEYRNVQMYSKLVKLKDTIPEVNLIYMYNNPQGFDKRMKKKGSLEIILLKNKTIDSKDCGNISPIYFSVNITTYTESLNYNSCLNCKIAIKENGDIKQCPSIKKAYGNISNTSLEYVVAKKNFTRLGSIRKDQIKVCKDCEFRHICTDCRAYVEDSEDEYSKPLKCGYDPYTGKWEEWSTNPLKQKAIKYYGLEHLIRIQNN